MNLPRWRISPRFYKRLDLFRFGTRKISQCNLHQGTIEFQGVRLPAQNFEVFANGFDIAAPNRSTECLLRRGAEAVVDRLAHDRFHERTSSFSFEACQLADVDSGCDERDDGRRREEAERVVRGFLFSRDSESLCSEIADDRFHRS